MNINKRFKKEEIYEDYKAYNLGYLEIKDIKNNNVNEKEINFFLKKNYTEMQKNITNIKADIIHSVIDSSLLFNKIDK